MKRQFRIFRFIFIVLVFVLLITPFSVVTVASPIESFSLFTTDANSSWFWSEFEVISDSSTLDSQLVNLAVDSENNIHVVWSDSTDLLGSLVDLDVFYRYYDSSLETWSPIELVSSESTSSSYDPVIAIDSNDNIYVAWEDYTDISGAGTDGDIFYKKKNVGGFWTTTSVVTTESNFNVAADMCLDGNDNVYFSWADLTNILGAGTDQDIFLKYYNNTSTTWSDTVLISTESSASSFDPSIAFDSIAGDVNIVWEDYMNILGAGSDLDLFYCKWNVYNSSLTNAELVSEGSTSASLDPSMKVNQNGDVIISWTDGHPYYDSSTDSDIYYRLRESSSATWNSIELVSTESTSNSASSKLSLDREGSVYIVWNDFTDYLGSGEGGSDWDIFFKFKDRATNKWSLSDVVSVESSDFSQYASIVSDNFGFIHCIWKETDDLGESGTDDDLFYRKFAGVPISPQLLQIIPNPTSLTNISLNWKDILSAEDYSIYRSDSYIWSVIDLNPLAITSDNIYVDTLNETGTYYYAVNARNEYGKSVLSNIEYVDFTITDGTDKLFSSLNLTEILIIAGIILGLQVLGSFITYSLVKSSAQSKKKAKKSKKK
ncbi:MAG: hypothetical protein HGN29_03550 [Asgard group archaeon]|nr:hypothetical protein [Asgard group archaeon]